MTTIRQPTDEELRARALARWEGEGGALIPTETADSIDESELRLLARLGAAVLGHWSELPSALKGRVVQRARTLGRPADHARVREALAAFLREPGGEC